MDGYIRSLATQLKTTGDRANIVVRLSFTGSPRIVPLMLDSRYSDWAAYMPYAEWALLGYVPQSENIWVQILAAANQRGLRGSLQELLEKYDLELHGPGKKRITAASRFPIIKRSLAEDNPQCWAEGSGAARKYPSSAFIPRLIAIALTSSPVPGQPRDNAIYALGEYRTDESVRALHLLLTDPDAAIRRLTEDHIRNTYQNRNRAIDPSHYLRDDDFDASFR